MSKPPEYQMPRSNQPPTNPEKTPGSGIDNYIESPPEGPNDPIPRSKADAYNQNPAVFVPYRGRNTHGVDAPLGQPGQPDLPLTKPMDDVVPIDKRITKPEPVDVRVVEFTDRSSIVRHRSYAINVPAATGGATYGQAIPIFGRDLSRNRVWLCHNFPAGESVYISEDEITDNSFPLPDGVHNDFGPIYTQNPLYVFTNSANIHQLFVYMEYTTDLVT